MLKKTFALLRGLLGIESKPVSVPGAATTSATTGSYYHVIYGPDDRVEITPKGREVVRKIGQVKSESRKKTVKKAAPKKKTPVKKTTKNKTARKAR